MEHRLSPRLPCPFPVTIDHLNLRLPSSVVSNASRDGISILTTGVLLPSHAVVNVTIKHHPVNMHFPSSTLNGPSETVPALVVYSTARQAGLWFYKDKHVWAKYWDLISRNQEIASRATSNSAQRTGYTTYQIGPGYQTYPIGTVNDGAKLSA